jgi:hypothetical protein
MSTLEVIKAINDEINQADEDADLAIEQRKIELAQEKAMDIDGGNFHDGFENIMRCINTPMEESINLYGMRLMAIIASSYKNGEHDEEKYAEVESKIKELTSLIEADNELIIDLKDKQKSVHKDRSELEKQYYEALDSNMENQRYVLRSIDDEFKILHEQSDDLLAQLRISMVRRDKTQVELDASFNELKELRKLALSDIFHTRAKLFYDPTWSKADSFDEKLSPSAKKTLIDAFKKPILDKLSNFNLSDEYDSHVMTGVLAVPPPRGAFSGATHDDITDFTNSEIGKKLSNILKLHISTRHGDFSNRLFRDVVLTSTPQEVELNDFQEQMYFINLTAMAGYDPKRWARAFGVPISGIGKQILNAWDNGRAGPITPERLIKLFESGRMPYTNALSYSENERSVELELAAEDLKQKEMMKAKARRDAEKAFPRQPQKVIVVAPGDVDPTDESKHEQDDA